MEWRNVFASNTLDKFVANAVEVKDLLEQVKTNVESSRTYIVALVVETAIAILESERNPLLRSSSEPPFCHSRRRPAMRPST
ncbi:hypothetical protein GCM10009550_33850 [Actinocorallia libanotica]|uniref:Uncharacterized protein n=1 Tax=Actinocorallia libanotica TaxID=46162 RepID=A0ABP4BRD0_9ACTN